MLWSAPADSGYYTPDMHISQLFLHIFSFISLFLLILSLFLPCYLLFYSDFTVFHHV